MVTQVLVPGVPLPGPRARPHDISPHFCGTTEAEARVAERLLRHEGTPEAIREFCRCRNQLGDYMYWFLLGTLWVSYTGFSDLALWKKLFAAPRPNRAACLMKPSELRALQLLPERFVVYRAHRPNETDWIAYTLDRDIAASRFASKRGVSSIHAYEVAREDVLALFLRREEQEVLVLDRSRVKLLRELLIVVSKYSEVRDGRPAGNG